MTADENVPNEQALEIAWIAFSDADSVNDAAEEFERGIDQIKRDAAKEALDGLADDFDMWHQDMHTDEVARRIRHEMKLLYPKETP